MYVRRTHDSKLKSCCISPLFKKAYIKDNRIILIFA